MITGVVLAVALLVVVALISVVLSWMAPGEGWSLGKLGVALVCLVLAAGGLLYLQELREQDEKDDETAEATTTTTEEPSQLVGGCEVFQVYAQNQFEDYGAIEREGVTPTSRKVGTFAPNEIIAVDGWVLGQQAYPTNPEPWNNAVWYHLSDDSGWVSFAAVRAYPTGPVADRLGGHGPAPLEGSCGGSVRPRSGG